MDKINISKNFLSNEKKSARSVIASTFVISTFFLLSLVFRKRYEDLFLVKYIYYYTTALIMIIGITLSTIIRKIRYSEKITTNLVEWQYCLIFFLIICTVSTVISDYSYEAFWGNEGRYNGLFLMLLYCVSTFLIGKYFNMKQWYLDVFLSSGLLVNLIGIGDYFKLNLLHFKNLSDRGADIFTSTIGNINFYTAYVALTLGCSAGLFIVEKNIKRCIAYYICFIISFSAIIMGASDNAYLSIIAIFVILPFYTLKSNNAMNRNIILAASSITVFKIIANINSVYKSKVVAVDGLLSLAGNQSGIWWLILLIWGIVLYSALRIRIHKIKKENRFRNYYQTIWLLIVVFALSLVVFILWDVNINQNFERYGSMKNYLFFDDDWGTNRGFAWRIAWEHFQNFPILRKIFGYGLDTFGILTIFNNKHEMFIGQGSYYDSIHNEYLQYLVTIGVAGIVSYTLFLVIAIRSMIKNLTNAPYLLGIVLPVFAYCIQAIVNINQVPVSSLMWCLIATGMAACRNTN